MITGALKAAALALAGGFIFSTAHAQTWTGAADTDDWATAGNWNNNAVPGSSDAVTLNPTTAAIYAKPHPVISSGNWSIAGLVMNGAVASGWSSTLTLNSTGTLAIGVGTIRIGGAAGSAGYVNVTGNAYISFAAANVDFGYNGTGYVAVSGSAVMEHLHTNGQAILAEAGASAGYVTIKENARWNISSTLATALITGFNGSGGGYVTIQDSARVTVANGGVELARATATAKSELTLSSTNAANRATLAAKLGIQGSTAVAGNAKLTFDGGVLQALAGSGTFIRGNIAITTKGDGAFIDSNGFDIGIASTVTFTGTSGLTKLGAGSLTLNNTLGYTGSTTVNAGSLVLTAAGQLANSSGVNIADIGAISANGFAQTLNNLSGAGAVTLGTGAATLNNTAASTFSGNLTAASISKTGVGTLTLSGSNSVSGNTTLNGGMLVIGSASAIGTGAGQTIAITSGTLGGTAVSLKLAHAITVQSGAQVAIDTNAGGRMEFTGAITGDSGVSKTGAGDLVLSGNLSGLSGAINVNQGSLFTTSYTGNVSIAAGGAFGGSGTITGNVTFAGAGNLQAGLTHNDATVTTPSTLTINGALSFGGAATLSHDMYASGADTIIATSASFGSATNTIDLVNIQTGTFTLLKLTSDIFSDSILTGLSITQNGGSPLNSIRSSATYALSTDKTELQVISNKTNQVLTWTGATDGNWDSTTGNWSGLDTKFVSGDKVIFDATGSNAINIMSTGAVVSEMSISGNGSYTFTGGALTVDANSTGVLGTSFGGVAPAGIFTINTTGTVTLANSTPNSFTNGIDVRQGTLIGSVAHFGDAKIANNGATIFNQTGNATYTGILTGTGVLGKTGAGTLTVGNNLAGFTGRTELAGGTLTFSASVTYNSSAITGSNSNVTAGTDFTFAGPTTLTNGSFTISNNSHVGSIAISGTGNITAGNNNTITGSAATGTGNIVIGTNSVINGSATAQSGTINIGANGSIQGPAVIQGAGAIIVGATSAISGSASVGSGVISIGTHGILGGPAAINGVGGVWLGASGTIKGAAEIQTGTMFLSANSYVDGPVTSTGAYFMVDLLEGSKINGSVSTAGATGIYLSTGSLVITNTTFPTGSGAPVVTSTSVPNPSRIAGDLTINSGPATAVVFGAGIIDGTLHVANNSTNVHIGVTRNAYTSGTYNMAYYDRVGVLKIGKIVLDGGGRLVGSGTIMTDSVSFNNTLTLDNGSGVNAFTSGLVVTGSLVGSGDVIKTGSGNVILEAPSSYTGRTTVAEGSLIARAENALSPNSPSFHINQGASLSLGGFSHTLPEVINHGRIYIGGNNLPNAGIKLTITGSYDSGNTGGISFNIIAADKTKTLSDQLVFTNAANISGTTKVFVQFTDNRTDWTRVVYDLDPIIIAEAGELVPGTFVLDDGRGYDRVVMSQRDYVIKYTDAGIELKATTAAEMPAALAANAVSIMANRAAYGSINQRLDYLHAAHALPGDNDTGVQAWAQTYYRADKLDGAQFPDSDGTTWGVQAGVDKRKKRAGKTYTIYGAFMDHTEASATLTNKTETDLSSTGIGAYLSAYSDLDWHVDVAARYSWDEYKISIGDVYSYQNGEQSMETDGYTWGAMVRAIKICDLGKDWTLIPQIQLAYQQRKINSATDTFGRTYTFGPEQMRVNVPASFEGRLGLGIRKLITVSDTVSLAPYLNANFVYEFKGDLMVTTVNNAFVREDFGGGSCLITAGLPARLGRRVDAYMDVSLQTGGPITGYGLNAGINYRW